MLDDRIMYLISAYFDEKSNKTIERYICQIAEKTGNRFMTDNKVPPHLTITALEARKGESLIPYVENLNGHLQKGRIPFVSVGMLLPYVLYLTPVLNEYLQDMSQQIYDAVSVIPEVSVNKYYQPMQWLPHVTLGKKLTKEQMQIAVKIMQDGFARFDATIVRVGLAKTNPHEDILMIEL